MQQVSSFASGGLAYTGLLPARPLDRAGFGIATAYVGEPFQDASNNAGTAITGHELALEWTYRILVTPWLALQPDVQWVQHPSALAGRPDAVVLALRTEVTF